MKFYIPEDNLDVGRAAMLIALTVNKEDEKKVKGYLRKNGFACAATRTGGLANDKFFQKLIDSIMGAAVNNNIINNNSKCEVHALIHANREAKHGFLLDVPSSTNVAIKIGIVRKNNFIAVAMFGNSALHKLTDHSRAGMGVMHI